MHSAEFIYHGPDVAGHVHCASITSTSEGELLCTWYIYPEEETHDGRLVLARKPAGESEWSRANILPFKMVSSLGNPVIFQDPTGAIWLHFMALQGNFWNSAVWYAARSDDLGRTFGPPRMVSPEEGLMIRHAPIFLDNGRALMPTYSDRSRESSLYASNAPYTEWKLAFAFDGFPVIQPSLIRAADKLMVFFRPSDDARVAWRSVSSDEGKSWSDPMRLPLPNPLSGIAAFALEERVHLVYNHTEEHHRYPLSIARSNLKLHQWSSPWHIEQMEFEVSYPSFVVDDSNVVHGVYTYNRQLIKYVSFDESGIEIDE